MYNHRASYFRGDRYGNHRRFNRFNYKQPSSESVHSFIRKASVQERNVEEIRPTRQFNELAISDKLKQNIIQRGFTTLMPIQEKGIPEILQGKDVIGIANTGTGKTAAFLIPIINSIINDASYKAIIIAPTRELAIQIRDELRVFSNGIPIYSTVCIGKSNIRNQIYDLKRHPHVVIGTPGRLLDLIERNVLKLSFFNMVVLDEVDRMLDMGFLPDVKNIISHLPKIRQSLFFSATVSPDINRLIQSFVVNPITISVKTQETTSYIHQDVIHIKSSEIKSDVLHKLLGEAEFKKVLIFRKTKMGVEKLSRELYQKGHKVTSIHGDKPQFKRQQAIRMFKEDAVKILVATDVAARGLDIQNISHVINYDVPASYDDYIHRIGRTGRANSRGVALTFIEG